MKITFSFEFPIGDLNFPNIDGYTTVYQLKEFIYRETDIPIPLQQIYYQGRLLHDLKNLYDLVTSFAGNHNVLSVTLSALCRHRQSLTSEESVIQGLSRVIRLPPEDLEHVTPYRHSLFFNHTPVPIPEQWRCERSAVDGNFTISHPITRRRTRVWLIVWAVFPDTGEVCYYLYDYTADVGERAVAMVQEQRAEDKNPPAHLICPITQALFRNPVICGDGHTYEEDAIVHWWTTNRLTSPLTNQPLTSQLLIPNRAIRQAVEDWTTAQDTETPDASN